MQNSQCILYGLLCTLECLGSLKSSVWSLLYFSYRREFCCILYSVLLVYKGGLSFSRLSLWYFSDVFTHYSATFPISFAHSLLLHCMIELFSFSDKILFLYKFHFQPFYTPLKDKALEIEVYSF